MSGQFQDTGVAVIGMAGRFPGAKNLDEFWVNLCRGTESISFFSDEELRAAGVEDGMLANPAYVKAAPVLPDYDRFDAAFFSYTPREATMIDPQQRVLLECAWHAMENAGYDGDAYPHPIGVFAGSSLNTYVLFTGIAQQFRNDYISMLIASDKDFLATRIAYKLNLRGPAITVQTACSTSLVAVHLARQSLLSGECDMALAGGVAVKAPHLSGYLWREGGMLSRDGHCRAFDAAASGTIFGSGAGMVALKRLDDALADGDFIHAVIKGSAVNNDGSAKGTYTSPSIEQQANVIIEALANADVHPDAISYIETHGTGTPLGDPIEIAAYAKAFLTGTKRRAYCAIGSVKANLGHLEAAAGIAGFIKTALALRHGAIPPSINFKASALDAGLDATPFFVNTELSPWPRAAQPRRAGVNALGVGGTNAHVILEEAPAVTASRPAAGYQLLPWSAKNSRVLAVMRENLAHHLANHPDLILADAAYTLQVGRRHLGQRAFLVGRTTQDAILELSLMRSEELSMLRNENAPGAGSFPIDVIFHFSDLLGMPAAAAADLRRDAPSYRRCIEQCCATLSAGVRNSVERALAAEAEELEPLAALIVEYAIAETWKSWGVLPAACAGDQLGRIAAAAASGAITLEGAASAVIEGRRLPVIFPSETTAAGGRQRVVLEIGASPPSGSAARHMLINLGRLWTAGMSVNWQALHAGERRLRTPLPPYPFERTRHWWDNRPAQPRALAAQAD